MKFSIFLFFIALLSGIEVQPVLVAGQQIFNSFDKRPVNKVNPFFNDSDDGVIILAAFRRPGGSFRGKYKKLITTTTAKVTITEATTSTTAAPTSTTEATTEKVIPVTHEQVVKVSTEESAMVNLRRNNLTRGDYHNALWTERKRVTRPPKYVEKKKTPKVIVVDEEEDYSVRRARYLFTQRLGKK